MNNCRTRKNVPLNSDVKARILNYYNYIEKSLQVSCDVKTIIFSFNFMYICMWLLQLISEFFAFLLLLNYMWLAKSADRFFF